MRMSPNLEEGRVLLDEGLQFGIGIVQPFGDDAHVGDNWHEVGITIPTGHYMDVDVVVDAGASSLAEVDANVKAIRTHGLA